MLTIELLKEFGADIESGMARCVNSESLYLRLVKMVPNNDGFNKLYSSIKDNNLDSAFEAAHGLKGITSNLALTPLLIPISEITDLLRNKVNMDYSKLINKIEEERVKLSNICV